MQRRSKLILAAATGTLLAAASLERASASVAYSYVPSQTTFNATAGQSITINLYLKETLSSSSSILAPNVENGLNSAGVAFTGVANGLQFPSTVTGAAADSTDFNGGSSFTVASFTASGAKINDSQGLASDSAGVQLGNQPALAGSVTTPADEVFLGTVTVQAGSSAGTTTFNIGEYNTSHGNTNTFNNGYDLDVTRTSSPAYTGVGLTTTQFSVTVSSPEPASVALLGIAGAGLLLRRRKASV